MRRLVGFRSLLKSKLDVATRRLERAIWFYSFTGFYFLCGKLVRGFPLRFNLSHIYYLHTVHAQKTDNYEKFLRLRDIRHRLWSRLAPFGHRTLKR